MANSSSYFIHNDDLFRATVVLLTAMTYSVGSSSPTNDSKDLIIYVKYIKYSKII